LSSSSLPPVSSTAQNPKPRRALPVASHGNGVRALLPSRLARPAVAAASTARATSGPGSAAAPSTSTTPAGIVAPGAPRRPP
jgi:hypothetical protein